MPGVEPAITGRGPGGRRQDAACAIEDTAGNAKSAAYAKAKSLADVSQRTQPPILQHFSAMAVTDGRRAHHEVTQFAGALCRHPVVSQRGQQGRDLSLHPARARLIRFARIAPGQRVPRPAEQHVEEGQAMVRIADFER